ncbi:hypothetical protein [Aquimarina sp. MMG016]|uniref:hypothetical protein n=1 Tax=Aquimarina sp. MMG016 TaxID=2822690 RepID=UPI001B39E8AC|nr:hypothetical protein [Aquimarina sp. MMG016]MBQ4822094.1 hypothetical protein [Aquimarina sp. MMG016]
MKKLSLVIIVGVLILLYSCQEENIFEEQTTISESSDIDIQTKGPSGRFCKFTLQFNARSEINPATGKRECVYNPFEICAIVDCLPNPFVEFEPPLIIFDPCAIIPCGWDIQDPWIIPEVLDPAALVSLKDKLQLDIDPRSQGVPIALNKSILVMQLYKETNMLSLINQSSSNDIAHYEAFTQPQPQPSIFYLDRKLILDAEVTKNLGLHGNAIKAGKYPVIFNRENNTYNVVLSVNRGFYE